MGEVVESGFLSQAVFGLKGLFDISLNRYQMENFERSLVKVFSSKIETLLNITSFLRINPRSHHEPFVQG